MAAVSGCGGSAAPAPSAGAATPLQVAQRSFAALRRAPRASDRLPGTPPWGTGAITESRRVYRGRYGRIWLYVRGAQLCTVDAIGTAAAAGDCTPVATAGDPRVAENRFGYLGVPPRIVFATLPDSVRTVTFARRGGNTTVRVRDNAVVFAAPGIQSWSFAMPGGAMRGGPGPE